MSRPGYVDKRGSNRNRAARRAWLLKTFDVDLGPEQARCALKLSASCQIIVDTQSLSVDRIEMGGSYRRGNIQPACKPCQDRQGGIATATGPNREMIEAYRDVVHAREALRESDTPAPSSIAGIAHSGVVCSQLEREDFDRAFPLVSFRDWLVDWHESRRERDTETPWSDEQRTA